MEQIHSDKAKQEVGLNQYKPNFLTGSSLIHKINASALAFEQCFLRLCSVISLIIVAVMLIGANIEYQLCASLLRFYTEHASTLPTETSQPQLS